MFVAPRSAVDKTTFALKADVMESVLREQGFSKEEIHDRVVAASKQLSQAKEDSMSGADVAMPSALAKVVAKSKNEKGSKKKKAEAAKAAAAAAKDGKTKTEEQVALAAPAAEEAPAAAAEAPPPADAAAAQAPEGLPAEASSASLLPAELNYSQFVTVLLCDPNDVAAEAAVKRIKPSLRRGATLVKLSLLARPAPTAESLMSSASRHISGKQQEGAKGEEEAGPAAEDGAHGHAEGAGELHRFLVYFKGIEALIASRLHCRHGRKAGKLLLFGFVWQRVRADSSIAPCGLA